MSAPNASTEAPARWERASTIVVFALAALAFLYIGWAYHTQRTYNALMSELMSADAAKSAAASATLAADDAALPYLGAALVNEPRPAARALAAKTILRRLDERRGTIDAKTGDVDRQAILSAGVNLEAVTRALGDESPEVRAAALAVVALTGTHADFQRNRLDEMNEFEGLLKRVASADPAEQKAAAEGFRLAGERALPYLVGVVFSDDRDLRRRGLSALRAGIQEILKSSNQRRVVPLLGRRRCRLLLAELPRLDEADRAIVTDVLGVSGRVSPDLFARVLTQWPTLDAAAREKLLADSIESLELAENLRGSTPPEVEKVEKLHNKT